MKTITDEAVLAFLRGLTGKTTLLDPSGTVIGHFHPVDPKDVELYAQVIPLYDPEEIARRKADPRRRIPMAEVLDRLKALENGASDPPTIVETTRGLNR